MIATESTEDWPTRLRRAAVADVYEVRAMVEVQAARLAATRRTDADVAAMRSALGQRRTAAAGAGHAAFVDADIALHAAVVEAAHKPVLSDLFAEFVPALRQGLIDLVEFLGLRDEEPQHGDARHAALVEAVAEGDGEAASRILQTEPDGTPAQLLGH